MRAQGDRLPAGQRPDQRYNPPPASVAAGGRSGTVLARRVIIFGVNEGLFEYVGTPALGNPPITWATAPGVTTDPYGNTLPVSGGIASEAQGGGLLAQLFDGEVVFGDTLSADALTYDGLMRIIHMAAHNATPIVAIDSPAADTKQTHSSLWMIGGSQNYVSGDFIQVALFAEDDTLTEQPVIFILCGVLAPGDIFGGLPTAFGPTLGGDTHGINISSPVGLAEQTSPPPTPTGAGYIYVNSTGHLVYLGPTGTSTVLANP